MSYMQSYEGINPYGVTDTMTKILVNSSSILRLSDCIPRGGVYTLQFWVKSSQSLDVTLESSGLSESFKSTPEWTQHVYTFTATNDDNRSIYFDLPVGIYYLYHVKLEVGDLASEYTVKPSTRLRLMAVGDPVESKLYRLSDKYADKLGCDNGIWYIERNTQLITLTGSEEWWDDGAVYEFGLPMVGDAHKLLPALCSHFAYYSDYFVPDGHFTVMNESSNTYLCFSRSVATDLDSFKTWLSNHQVTVLLPANTTTVPLANYLQTTLNSFVSGDNLSVHFSEGVHSMSGAVMTKSIVFGEVNSDMSALINNLSDDSVGFIYQIHCKGVVTNPTIYLTETGEHIKLNDTFKLNDVITIDTRRGKKSVTKTYRGETFNIINSLDNTSKWLQLQSGYNHLIQSADSGDEVMDSTIIYTNEYEGV